jgi:ADP-heptose:LPS heptosyltransferase
MLIKPNAFTGFGLLGQSLLSRFDLQREDVKGNLWTLPAPPQSIGRIRPLAKKRQPDPPPTTLTAHKQAYKILFVRTDRMGDVLMNLPAIRVLRQTFPKAWITLLVDRSVSGLFENHPDLDEVMVIDRAKLEKSWAGRLGLIQKIRKIHFDLAVVSNPHKFWHALTFMAAIPERIGWRRKWGFLLTKNLKDAKSQTSKHEIDFNLDLVSLVSNKQWDKKIVLPVDEESLKKIDSLLEAKEAVITIHPGTSNPKKQWPLERFAKVCDDVEQKGLGVILIGGEPEKELSRQIGRMTKQSPIDWTGELSLKDLSAFLSHPKVKCLVSCDSGPVHVAWMHGKPVVALYAQNAAGSNPARWGPLDGKSQVIYKQMMDISVSEVCLAVDRILLNRNSLLSS